MEKFRRQGLKGKANNPFGSPKRRVGIYMTEDGVTILKKLSASAGSMGNFVEAIARRLYIIEESPTIASIVKGYERELLVSSTTINSERWEAIANGDRPTDNELMEICRFLELDILGNVQIGHLAKIRERDFNNNENGTQSNDEVLPSSKGI